MRQKNKKVYEEHVFKCFCCLSRNDFTSFNHFEEELTPDFVSKDAKFAIELVEYHRDAHQGAKSFLRENEKFTRQIVDQAKAMYYKSSDSKMVDVYVGVQREAFRGKKINGKVLASSLKDLVIRKGPSAEIDNECALGEIFPYIDHISIGPSPSYAKHSYWGISEANIIDINPESVKSQINSKNKKLIHYKKHAEQVYLLMHSSSIPVIGLNSDSGRFSSSGYIGCYRIGKLDIQSSFDKIYYLSLGENKFIELSYNRINSILEDRG